MESVLVCLLLKIVGWFLKLCSQYTLSITTERCWGNQSNESCTSDLCTVATPFNWLASTVNVQLLLATCPWRLCMRSQFLIKSVLFVYRCSSFVSHLSIKGINHFMKFLSNHQSKQ